MWGNVVNLKHLNSTRFTTIDLQSNIRKPNPVTKRDPTVCVCVCVCVCVYIYIYIC